MRPQSATTPTHADAPAAPHTSSPSSHAPDAPHTQQPGFGPQAGTPHAPSPSGTPNSPSAHSPGSRPDAPSSRPDAPGARSDAPKGRPDTPSSPGSRPDGPGSRPDGTRPDASRPRTDAPGGHPNSPSRPDTPSSHNRPDARPDAPTHGNRPDGSRPDTSRPDGTRPDGTRPHGDSPATHPSQRADAPSHAPDKPGHAPDQPSHAPDGHGPDGAPHRDTDAPDQHHDKPDGPSDPHHGQQDGFDPDDVNTRHAETTQAGVSHHAGDENMGDLPHKIAEHPPFFTADVHITPDGKARIGGRDYTPEQYAELLRRSGWDGKSPIRLIGCDAGSNDFAKQLARHTDVDVLAPNKPAWSDSKGRLFTSDAEVDAHGNRQPKIPPNGDWEVHSPDGSKTKAGDDGFAPNTDPKDKGDLDPTDAKDRAGRDIPDQPVKIEDRNPPALMEEKLKDKDYRDKYYDGPNSNGDYSRKNANQTDHNGDEIPKLAENPKGSGNFEATSDDFVKANYREDMPEVKHEATDAQKQAAQDIIDRREASLERTKTAEEKYQGETSGDRDATPDTAEERRAAHHERSLVGEELGEHAAADAVRDSFPPEKFDVAPLHDPDVSGSGRFDQVYEVKNKETGETRLVVVEAKGPNAELGTRKGAGNLNYQQGHPKYVDSVIENMAEKGTPTERALAQRLEDAKMDGNLDYTVVKARVSGSGDAAEYGGYTQKHFDLTDD